MEYQIAVAKGCPVDTPDDCAAPMASTEEFSERWASAEDAQTRWRLTDQDFFQHNIEVGGDYATLFGSDRVLRSRRTFRGS
jgi:hypothetical protein